jgi:large subunit ribosomal protein L11
MADPSPPLGTVLGNLGVNTNTFCTSFNLYTKNLSKYFLLKVTINILENRTTTFSVKLPSIGFILGLLRFSKIIKVKVHDRLHEKSVLCVNIYSLLKLSKFKFPYCNLKQSFSIVLGTVKSMKLTIVN